MSRQGQHTSVSSSNAVDLVLGTYVSDPIDMLNFEHLSLLAFWGTATAPTGSITDEYSNDGVNWVPGSTSADLAVDSVFDLQYSNFPYRYARINMQVLTGGGGPDQLVYTTIKK